MSRWLAGAARLFATCALFLVFGVTALLSIPLSGLLGVDLAVCDWARARLKRLGF